MRALLIALLLFAAPKPADFENHPAVALSNDKLELTVTMLGASFAKLALRDDPQAANPFWEPVRMARESGRRSEFRGGTGHFVCVDGFGSVSEAERAAGLPGHGEAHLQQYEIKRSADGELTLETTLPIVQEKFTRKLRVVDGENVVYVHSELENLLGFDRPVNWAEHATVGSPFLDSGNTVVDVAGTRSLTRPYDQGPMDASLKRLDPSKEFTWPMAPGLDGRPVNLRETPKQPNYIDHAATLIDPGRKYGWVTALNVEKRLIVGYVFKREEYPWVQYWGDYPATLKLARGLEFSTQPFDVPRRETIELKTLFGAAVYRWLPAKGTIFSDFLLFYAHAPEGMTRVDELRVEPGRLVLEDRAAKKTLSLPASLGI